MPTPLRIKMVISGISGKLSEVCGICVAGAAGVGAAVGAGVGVGVGEGSGVGVGFGV